MASLGNSVSAFRTLPNAAKRWQSLTVIEPAFSKIKQPLRRLSLRTVAVIAKDAPPFLWSVLDDRDVVADAKLIVQ